MNRRDLVSGAALIALSSAITASEAAAAVPKDAWTVRDGRTGKELRWRDLPARLAGANAIFVGEQHDDPETHQAEAALLEAVHGKAGGRLTLAMEMLERDAQPALNDYLAGKLDEPALAKATRLWPNYTTDYRPLIEYAKAKGVPVLASNAPRRLVSRVGKEGLSAVLASLPPEDRALIASSITAPDGDPYAARFAAVMSQGHGGPGAMTPEAIRRIYEAQCVRDDTMAETVAGAIRAGRTVFHVNGSFHSDAGFGTAARVLWRCPLEARLAVVKIVPYKNRIEWESLRGEADYLIFVPDHRDDKTA